MRGLALLLAAAHTSVFEPFVAIDPGRPDRIVAGAQYGDGYNRGGLTFRTRVTSDGGRNWSEQEVAFRALERAPTMAADLSLAFGVEGELYALAISGDGLRDRVPEAALALGVSEDGGRTFTPRALLGESVDHPDGSFTVSDKPWLALDGTPGSPFRGNLYFAWTSIDVRKRNEGGYDLHSTLVFSVSRDRGRSHSTALAIADSGGGAQIAVRPDGTVDLVWLEEKENRSPRLLHALSRDGGARFGAATVIESLDEASESLDLPTLTVSSQGVLSACWPRGGVSRAAGTSIRCSRYDERTGWAQPASVKTTSLASGYPAVAAAGDAFWLLGYHAEETLSVSLYCATDGRNFNFVETLAKSRFPAERFCARPGLPCRKDPAEFTPGDYVGLAGSSRRLAAAYVLPDQRPVVSVVNLGDETCSIAGSSSTRN